MEVLWGRGYQKPKFLKESMELDWNFQRGGGGGGRVKPKKPSVDISGTTQSVERINRENRMQIIIICKKKSSDSCHA